jgi:ubiquinone/menaquinone biosynthesis C-methylase UbiE
MPEDKGYTRVPVDPAVRARNHVERMEALAHVRGQRVLDVGCHRGDMAEILAREYDCEVVGIDLEAQDNWDEVQERTPSLTLLEADISKPHPALREDSFDRIVSVSVWGHVHHPFSALRCCQQYLKPEGKKYLYSMLYRSAATSGLIERIEERWPHLIFSPDEILDRLGVNKLGGSFWMNKLTYQQYLFYFRRLGFYITHESFNRDAWDAKTYEQYEHVLKLYPEWDLSTDFFRVVLEFDRDHPKAPIEDPVYRTGG